MIDYKEHTVESLERFIPIFADPVKHTWFTIEKEDLIVVRDFSVLFQTKLRLSAVSESATPAIYTLSLHDALPIS